jgi:hypothetical protein
VTGRAEGEGVGMLNQQQAMAIYSLLHEAIL